jgi:hypothetical protein
MWVPALPHPHPHSMPSLDRNLFVSPHRSHGDPASRVPFVCAVPCVGSYIFDDPLSALDASVANQVSSVLPCMYGWERDREMGGGGCFVFSGMCVVCGCVVASVSAVCGVFGA